MARVPCCSRGSPAPAVGSGSFSASHAPTTFIELASIDCGTARCDDNRTDPLALVTVRDADHRDLLYARTPEAEPGNVDAAIRQRWLGDHG